MKTKFLKTYELTTEIIKLIESTKSYCYIVSPYIKIWPQLERALNIASTKQIFLTFIIREDPKSSFLIQKLNIELGFEVFVIKDLHIKLYLNEAGCILSTMNLYDASQQNNLELGYFVIDSNNIKKNILEDYILSDITAVRYPGRFENKRFEILKNVSATKEILNQKGFCVDCNQSIDSDFSSNSPRYIRCYSCYVNHNPNFNKIKFCHFCGKQHVSFDYRPFHIECETKLIEYRRVVKNYQ